jgi:hypothetical protein
MLLNFEVINNRNGPVGRLTISISQVHLSRMERRVARLLVAECARRGFAVHGDIKIEAQENWITGALDVTAAAFVAAIDGIATGPARRTVGSSAPATIAQRSRRPSR